MGVLFRTTKLRKEKGRDRRVGRLFVTKLKSLESPSCYFSSPSNSNSEMLWHLWHKRLSHPHSDKLNKTFSSGLQHNKTISDFTKIDKSCITCSLNKSTIIPFSVSHKRHSVPFDNSQDAWGPSPKISRL